MKRPPFPALKFQLVLLVVALLLAGSGTLWSMRQVQDAQLALQQQNTTLNDARQQLDRSRQQQQLIATHLADYQALTARGFVGPEDRLAWIEAAQRANRDAGLYGLEYRLLPRTPALPGLAQGLALGQTTMTLTLPLLVESDLARFLAALKVRAPGVYRVQSCQLSRRNGTPIGMEQAPQLRAECELQWFTVAEKPEARR